MLTNNTDLINIINDKSQITHRKSIKLVEKRIKSCRKNKKERGKKVGFVHHGNTCTTDEIGNKGCQ